MSSRMIALNVLFNPTVRVWNLRILLLWTMFVFVVWSLGTSQAANIYDEVTPIEAGGISTLCFTIFHHTILGCAEPSFPHYSLTCRQFVWMALQSLGHC
jgi:hypothetical protein